MPKLKAIFFDMDETLIENTLPFPQLFSQLYHEQSDLLGDENFDRFIQHFRIGAPKLWASMFEQEASPESQLADLYTDSIKATETVGHTQARTLGENMLARFIELSSSQVRFNPDAELLMSELRERGYITGLITNGIEAVQLGKVKALKLDEKLDSITVSAQARAHKPKLPVFELALSRGKVNADQAWQVGDHAVNDVAGGIRAGLGGIYYNPKNHAISEAFNEIEERPTHTIKSLGELLELI